MEKPITTLFMLESLDGKINSGENDSLDVDRDWKNIKGVKEGLHQYYEIESETDLFSLNTGRVMEKIGINEKDEIPEKTIVNFIIIDNGLHLKEKGIKYLCNKANNLILVTTNKKHVAFNMKNDNLNILYYEQLNLEKMLIDIKEKYNAKRITIQCGGNMNARFLQEGLIDYVNIVIAPLLVGGRNTSTLIDGESIKSVSELNKLKSLELIELNKLENSYIQVIYKVNN